jgi:hypothetical protein
MLIISIYSIIYQNILNKYYPFFLISLKKTASAPTSMDVGYFFELNSKHNYTKVIIEDPYNNRDIIARVAKKQKGVYV